MRLELYQRVALSRNLPEHQLQQGDVAMLIDYVTHPEGGEDGCVLEVFSAVGDSIAVVAVSSLDVKPLRSNEVLTIRSLTQTS